LPLLRTDDADPDRPPSRDHIKAGDARAEHVAAFIERDLAT